MIRTGFFRIGFMDRLRGLLTGRVCSVRAVGTPTVFRSRFGGASVAIDHNAFGLGTPDGHYNPGPYLTINEPAYMMSVACPACRQVVDVLDIRRPPADEMAIVEQLQRTSVHRATFAPPVTP